MILLALSDKILHWEKWADGPEPSEGQISWCTELGATALASFSYSNIIIVSQKML